MTGVCLDLLIDIDQHLFIEAGIRGGVFTITHRYEKANVSGLGGYDESKPIEYLIYWDANNLECWAMSQYLPSGNFKWVDDVNEFDVQRISDESDVGYILKVDLGKFLYTLNLFALFNLIS